MIPDVEVIAAATFSPIPAPVVMVVAVPANVIFPLVVVIAAAALIPSLAAVEAPEVPISEIEPVVALIVPPVSDIPCAAPAVACELAVMAMVFAATVVAKLNPCAKPTLSLPVPPRIVVVAMILPDVENAAPTLMPWLVAPEPPVQLEKVVSPEVPVVQPKPMLTPCELAKLAPLVPLTLMAPDVLVIGFATPILIP
jgi:hypothetical protein